MCVHACERVYMLKVCRKTYIKEMLSLDDEKTEKKRTEMKLLLPLEKRENQLDNNNAHVAFSR